MSLHGVCPRCSEPSSPMERAPAPCEQCTRAEAEEAAWEGHPVIDVRLVRRRDGGWYARTEGGRVVMVGPMRGPSACLQLVVDRMREGP